MSVDSSCISSLAQQYEAAISKITDDFIIKYRSTATADDLIDASHQAILNLLTKHFSSDQLDEAAKQLSRKDSNENKKPSRGYIDGQDLDE
jgi:hypothetical protein